MTTEEAELIARVVAADDRAAFAELVRRHQSAVRRFLRHLCRGDAALADDLAQESFVQAYRGLAHYRQEAPFLTWLLGIAHNHWRNAWRKRSRERVMEATLAADETLPATSTSADLRHDLSCALRHLTADEQLAIHLNYQQGLSHSEIATLLAWPLGTVKTQLARAKDKLRQHLAAWNLQT